MLQETVKFHNALNKIQFTGFTATSLDIFYAICAQLKNNNTLSIAIPVSELKALVGFHSGSTVISSKTPTVELLPDGSLHEPATPTVLKRDFFNVVKEVCSSLQRIHVQFIELSENQTDENDTSAPSIQSFELISIFKRFLYCQGDDFIHIQLNEDFVWLFNNFEKTYTSFSIPEFCSFKSKYTRHLYRLLKQWQTKRFIAHDINEFRRLMDVPVNYTNRQFMQHCLNSAVKELQDSVTLFGSLTCTPVYAHKRGKPLSELIFDWRTDQDSKISPRAKTTNTNLKDTVLQENEVPYTDDMEFPFTEGESLPWLEDTDSRIKSTQTTPLPVDDTPEPEDDDCPFLV